jgi:hypothetical protein
VLENLSINAFLYYPGKTYVNNQHLCIITNVYRLQHLNKHLYVRKNSIDGQKIMTQGFSTAKPVIFNSNQKFIRATQS